MVPEFVCYQQKVTKLFSASLLVMLLLTVGCTRFGEFAKKRADIAAYEIVRQKQKEALGASQDFSIDAKEDPTTQETLEKSPRTSWNDDGLTSPIHQISLSDSLAVAINNNRDYISQKENLYSRALGLTETRRDFGPIFDAGGNFSHTRVEAGHDSEFGVTVNRSETRGFNGGVRKIFATGASVTVDFSHSFFRNFTSAAKGATNELSLNISQPLLAGAGPLVTREPIRQAERSMIYSVRSYNRFQKGFIIEAASTYYNLLSVLDQLNNALKNYQDAENDFKKVKRLAEGGRRTDIEVAQARQRMLEGEASLEDSRLNYQNQVDQFKRFLGLPLDIGLGPNSEELDTIQKNGIKKIDLSLEDAIEIALAERLDFKTSKESLEDRERQVKIAMRNFLPSLVASYDYSTQRNDPEKDRVNLNFRDNTQSYGFSLGLPLDWTVRRNNYRRSLLSFEQAKRDYDLDRDDLIIEVRNAWRQLERQRKVYQIQLESVRLAELRVRNSSLLLEQGKASTRDLLEAQDSLLDSKNALTTVLVDHTIQRLRFWNSIERLKIDSKGMWHE